MLLQSNLKLLSNLRKSWMKKLVLLLKKYELKHRPTRRTIANADQERDQANRILTTLQQELATKDAELLALTQQHLTLTKRYNLLDLIGRPRHNKETIYYSLLNEMRLNNLLTITLQPRTEAHTILLAEIKELLQVVPTHKEFKELLS